MCSGPCVKNTGHNDSCNMLKCYYLCLLYYYWHRFNTKWHYSSWLFRKLSFVNTWKVNICPWRNDFKIVPNHKILLRWNIWYLEQFCIQRGQPQCQEKVKREEKRQFLKYNNSIIWNWFAKACYKLKQVRWINRVSNFTKQTLLFTQPKESWPIA